MAMIKLAGLLAAAAAAVAAATPFSPPASHRPSPASLRRKSATAATAAATPLPDYALTYAPIYYLHSSESWWPSDIATHLQNVIPEIDFAPIAGFATAGSANLANLATVNASAYLTSKDNVDDSPAWQLSAYGKPDAAGYSAAPGTIIAVQKNATWVDVFYFTFYSYNHGGAVLGIQFDDHVGDWEHTMIRFVNGKPTHVYYSQHGAGSAYTYSAVNTTAAGRPLAFVGLGGHANYVKAGAEEYTIAGSIVTDKTNAGFAWDFVQNYRGYWFDNTTETFSPGGGATTDDASWLRWTGVWGDDKYSLTRSGQYCIASECHYTAGPTGPVAKNLGRTAPCQSASTTCTVYTSEDDITHQSRRGVEGGF